jgi:predicted nucleic acid-binding protein
MNILDPYNEHPYLDRALALLQDIDAGVEGVEDDVVVPAYLAKLTEEQTLAEIARLDKLQAQRGLSPEEFNVLRYLEVHLERLDADYEASRRRQAEMEKRIADGASEEEVFGPQHDTPGEAQTVNLDMAHHGIRNPLPIFIGLGLLVFFAKRKSK